ncbi:hypothetical protein PIB30_051779 [Stylosanthes scabra]|uniref:Secreted protein n=1 Tax=Stylosanthes scabra TaxID=79078 RepID=A0ABU6ZGT3_9FABA|nr:hypothetical protein [Stylosanthes scabra]
MSSLIVRSKVTTATICYAAISFLTVGYQSGILCGLSHGQALPLMRCCSILPHFSHAQPLFLVSFSTSTLPVPLQELRITTFCSTLQLLWSRLSDSTPPLPVLYRHCELQELQLVSLVRLLSYGVGEVAAAAISGREKKRFIALESLWVLVTRDCCGFHYFLVRTVPLRCTFLG